MLGPIIGRMLGPIEGRVCADDEGGRMEDGPACGGGLEPDDDAADDALRDSFEDALIEDDEDPALVEEDPALVEAEL